jgi:hypothetical protein
MTPGEADRKLHAINYHFQKRKQNMSEALLNDVMEYMEDEAKVTREVSAAGKWTELLFLNKELKKPEYQHVKLGGTPECLYERFYKAEPRPLCTEARFLIVMRQVYGFELANTDSICDSKILRHLQNLFYYFDACDSATGEATGQMDWKALVFALYLLKYPFKTNVEQMDWAFALYSSEGFLDATLSGHITHTDFVNMFSVPGATGSAIKFLKSTAEEALGNLQSEVAQELRSTDTVAAGRTTEEVLAAHAQLEVRRDATRKAVREGTMTEEQAALELAGNGNVGGGLGGKLRLDPGTGRVVLTHAAFRRLLGTEPVSDLLEPSTRMKFLSQWEEWYNPVLIEYLVKERKERFDSEKGAMYKKVLEQRLMYATLCKWGSFVMKRMRARALVSGNRSTISTSST